MNQKPTSPPLKTGAPPNTSLREAVAGLWQDYPWFTRCATLLLIGAALLNMAVNAQAPESLDLWPLTHVPPAWQQALASDGMLTLCTLLVALGIALYLKQRQIKGLLDGADHYDIGRALAFGYFSNFLVSALVLVRDESTRQNRRLVLRMISPRNIKDLEDFKHTVEPLVDKLTAKRDLEGVYRHGAPLVKRSMLVLSKVSSASDQEEIFFDFPTTLYTLHDYYATWNVWLEENGRPPLATETIDLLQERQIVAFKRHLLDLSRSQVGLNAVTHLGLQELDELTQLFKNHFMDIHPHEMHALIAPAQG